jgi:hypothetical protein
MAVGFLDFFGGSKRRTALQVLDRSLTELEVNPAYIDDGMRFAIYKWATAENADAASVDRAMREAAALISFCVIGGEETQALWGVDVRTARQKRFDRVIEDAEDETFDARLVKLVLAKGIAAPEIQALVGLEDR